MELPLNALLNGFSLEDLQNQISVVLPGYFSFLEYNYENFVMVNNKIKISMDEAELSDYITNIYINNDAIITLESLVMANNNYIFSYDIIEGQNHKRIRIVNLHRIHYDTIINYHNNRGYMNN